MVGSSVHQNVCTVHQTTRCRILIFPLISRVSSLLPPVHNLRPQPSAYDQTVHHVCLSAGMSVDVIASLIIVSPPPLLAICTSPYMFSLYLFLSPLDLCPPRGDLVTYPVRGGAARGTSCGPSSICSTSGRDSQ